MSERALTSIPQREVDAGHSHDASLEPPDRIGRSTRFLADRQTAEASLMFTKETGFRARADISNGGLLSVAALVSSILLTTSVLVHVAVRDGRRPWWRA